MNSANSAKRPLVLVADDADDSRTFFAMMLKPRYDTRLVSSGTQALQAASAEPRPDLILLDVQESGRQFDPQVVDAFRKKLVKIAEVRNMISDELEGIHDLNFTSDTEYALSDDVRPSAAAAGADG